MILLAIDPGGLGGHTGLVAFEYSDSECARVVWTDIVPGSVFDLVNWWDRPSIYPDHVVCEHFVNRNRPGADLTPVAVEGAVQTLCILKSIPLTLQPPGGKNTFVSDEVLKRMNWWWRGDHHHDRNEAARHAGLWFRHQFHRPTIDAMYRGSDNG